MDNYAAAAGDSIYGSGSSDPLYDNGAGYEPEASSAYGPGCASRTGLYASLPRIGDGILRSMRPVHDTGAGNGYEADSGSCTFNNSGYGSDYGSGAGPLYDSGAGSAYGPGYLSGAGSASGPGYASRTGLYASLPRIGDDILKSMRPPGLSEEWEEWYEGYTVWRLEQRVVLGKNEGLSYTVEPPPYHMRGDPNVVIKIKAPHWGLGVFLLSVEDAVKFYNKNNPGCEIEPLEVLSGNAFYWKGASIRHINFKAKPKIANSHDDCPLKFFAEIFIGSPVDMPYNDLPNKTEVLSCCLLEEGSTGDRCGFCPPERLVHHPLQPSAYKAGHPAFLHRPPDTEFIRNCRKITREFLTRKHSTGC